MCRAAEVEQRIFSIVVLTLKLGHSGWLGPKPFCLLEAIFTCSPLLTFIVKQVVPARMWGVSPPSVMSSSFFPMSLIACGPNALDRWEWNNRSGALCHGKREGLVGCLRVSSAEEEQDGS